MEESPGAGVEISDCIAFCWKDCITDLSSCLYVYKLQVWSLNS